MDNFHRVNELLHCEKVPLASVIRQEGTPTYVYSKKSIVRNFDLFRGAFESIDAQICFSVKSNSAIGILNLLALQGAGADIVSGGELFRALKAGMDPSKIVYSGVGKTGREIRYALESGIGMFNVESVPELETINEIARNMGKIAPVAVRVNPDIDANTHHFTTTGTKENKFGIAYSRIADLYAHINALGHVRPIGVDVHLGSPIYSLDPYRRALERLDPLIHALHGAGIAIHTLDIGGGYPIMYDQEATFTPLQFAEMIIPFVKKHAMRLIIEPGRFIVGNGGALLTTITYVKQSYDKTFYICDAGMNDLIRPALYGSFHRIEPVCAPAGARMIVADVVGPICESSDFFAKDRQVPEMAEGSHLAILSAGAYGFSMSSNYNSRPRACEVLVDDASFSVIRARESYDDLLRGETIAV